MDRPDALVPTENKQQITLRLDADVLSFLKDTGQRYQSRINAALREYMKAHKYQHARPAPRLPRGKAWSESRAGIGL
ncbi:MAG: BrnA antitoxin family protein [Burkholderiales bacterium]